MTNGETLSSFLDASPTISIVVPLYNEVDNVRPMVTRTLASLAQIDKRYELILVDDGSKDGTWDEIIRISAEHSCIRGISLSRNFGHQHALLAGLVCAKGMAIVSMDGDLQHPPELIPRMIDYWNQGFDVVDTWRQYNEGTSFFKRTSSKYFYKIFSNLAEVKLREGSSDFRLLDRRVLDALLSLKNEDIFLRGAIQWLGFNTYTLKFDVAERHSGKSKYSLKKMLSFATGALISFSTRPLRLGIGLGIATSLLAFLELIYILVQYIRGDTVSGWASTVGIVSFLMGILLIVVGIIGAYIGRIHSALQGRPSFVIAKDTTSITRSVVAEATPECSE